MTRINYFDRLVGRGNFLFKKLILPGIDNEPVIRVNKRDIIEQEICLFHQEVQKGEEYIETLHTIINESLEHRRAMPVVRFADGEYAFYRFTLECNGLYQQAESIDALCTVMPEHIAALQTLSRTGIIAPLIFPGNTRRKNKGFFSFFNRSASDDSAVRFLDFLQQNGVELTVMNYIPFYVVYAYLTSGDFARLVDRKKLCLLSSEFNPQACRQWFNRFHSHPEIIFREIPAAYMATQWGSMRSAILTSIPADVDICLVGAGVGALPVCVDLAVRFSMPAIDAGHVLNMMNGREDKSNAPRLYTLRKKG